MTADQKPRPVLVITGPTASGKSRLALDAAEEFRGTVINADSMQLYEELAILTARPMPNEQRGLPHKLYGVCKASEPCSVGAWLDMAWEEIASAWDEDRLPMMVGGTGLYLKALMEGLSPIPEVPQAIRQNARALHAEIGGAAFHTRLAERDPLSGERLEPGDSQRLIRAWEVLEATGRSLPDWQTDAPLAPPLAARFGVIVLDPPRPELRDAIDRRVARMVEAGALEEVGALLALGLDPELPAMKALGAALLGELIQAGAGEAETNKAIIALVTATRRYAKRQSTWNRGQIINAERISAQYSESLSKRIFSIIRNLLLTMK
ncbi:MAG: tRNA (adenosine(37)-N6)-dimethylallyltransferase MiaA [Rhodospirillales bacterium]|jgi:tRNA dimethylallyltransferase|nr:tRNA (adenosine(37)-N6)-dimethylallyltransferase MiaA [Rhodospirillales bacterium]